MINWKKYYTQFLLKLKRLNGTPYSIAAGCACGVAISFTPFIGFHMILAALTAFLVRGSIVASAIGTLVGNPWTFPFIWISVLWTGRFFLGIDKASSNINFGAIFESAKQAIWHLNFDFFARDVWPIIYPMMVGCIPYYIASWLVSYFLVKRTMDRIHTRKLRRLEQIKGDEQ